ncbi:alpha/beta fold hydrolase [Gynurincola endophyticus]|jgi:pimeloyl-ACP methyl ester carboxylesterase|uniref:alpha/beta fold hydrolase n=1 Tax=Gynurincola endophyticus TaxID=2479004 RepID=UPI000F8C3B50|nr:alpha/beta hydrolase [Gynurincola endophyticus]
MKIYAIPGMGADGRVFHKIQWPEGFECIRVEWIDPLKDESLAAYSMRLLSMINTGEPYALIGLSMGGMIASCFAQKHPPEFLILISSVSAYSELPPYYRWLGSTGIANAVPMRSLKFLSKLKRRIFKESAEDKELLLEMIEASDETFLSWSIKAILNWRGTRPATRIFHVHGKHDWLLPVRYIRHAPQLITGGHAMILSSANELQRALNAFLSEYPGNAK